MKSEGYNSAWYPYIQSLPEQVKCVSQTYEQDEINKITYQELINKLEHMNWVKEDAWTNMTPEAHGHSTKEEFEWALSIVHSRVFGTAGKEGFAIISCLILFLNK